MKNFVIVGTQRTGSSVLGESIGLHPQVVCGWEWTESLPYRKKIQTAQSALNGDFSGLKYDARDHINNQFSVDAEWLGFRRLFGASSYWVIHPRFSIKSWHDRLEGFIGYFRSIPNLHIIHIIRGNNIDWLKSKFLAQKASSFIGQKYPEGMQVDIPIREAIKRLQAKNWIDNRLITLRNENPYIQVVYEAMAHDRQSEIDKVLKFLDCDTGIVDVNKGIIRKQSSGATEQYISNYEQLIKELELRGLLKSQFT